MKHGMKANGRRFHQYHIETVVELQTFDARYILLTQRGER